MALSDIINKGACGLGAQKGFNVTKGCAIPFRDITEIWRTPWDFEIDGSVEFNEAYLRQLQADGSLTILKDVQSFEAQNTENQFSTNARGFKELAIDGIYEYKAMFNEDIWYNKQLGSLEGKKNNRFFLISNGAIYGTEGKEEGNIRGFGAYSTTRSLQTFTQGTETSSQSLEIQFASKSEIDDKPVLLAEDTLSFSTDDIEPIVQAYVAFNSVPTSGSTQVLVRAVLDRGRKDAISGLETGSNFVVTLNGIDETITLVEAPLKGSDAYTLTITNTLADDDVLTVSLNGIIDIEGDCLYISNTDTATTVSGGS